MKQTPFITSNKSTCTRDNLIFTLHKDTPPGLEMSMRTPRISEWVSNMKDQSSVKHFPMIFSNMIAPDNDEPFTFSNENSRIPV